MRNPLSRNPTQQSVYVDSLNWAAVKELGKMQTPPKNRSAYIVSLIERERIKQLGKDWKPK